MSWIETGNKKGKEWYNSSNKPELSKLQIESKENKNNQKEISKSTLEFSKLKEKELSIKETKNSLSNLQAEILLQRKIEAVSDNTKVSKKFKLWNIPHQNISSTTEITWNNGKKYEKDTSISIKKIKEDIKNLPERIQNIPWI